MNIRIGSNIHMDIVIDGVDLSQVKHAKCIFGCFENDCDSCCPDQFYHSSYYTLRTCGIPTYNVLPHSYWICDCCMHDNDCGKAYRFDVHADINTDNTISCTFPSVHLHEGTYRLMVCLFYEDGHRKFIRYGDVFDMDNCCDSLEGFVRLKAYRDCVFINNED